jgi:cyclophilin family peptidyl-prolyl cis-trans isomerase
MHKSPASQSFLSNARLYLRQLFALMLTTLLLGHIATAAEPTTTRVRIQTSMGTVVVELDSARAPLTVKNFLQYAKAGHYDGTLFHRVVPGFVVQGGGFDAQLKEKPTQGNLVNESGNGLTNRSGTIAMARTSHPHSATSQFFFNLSNNAELDPQPARWGYCVFGKVVEGMEIIQGIGEVPTKSVGEMDDVPTKVIMIQKVEVVE